MTINTDISEKAIENGWLIKLSGTENWVLTKNMTKLVKILHKIFEDEVSKKLVFSEWIVPRITPEQILSKSGWLTFHDYEAIYLDPTRHTHFSKSDLTKMERNGYAPINTQSQIKGKYILDPIQCISLYHSLMDTELDGNELPLKIYDKLGGWTWRNELKTDGFCKTIGFLRMEFIWIGTIDQVSKVRNNILEYSLSIFNNILNLPAEVIEGDSCFSEAADANRFSDKHLTISEAYSKPSVDIILERKDRSWTEIASGSRYSEIVKRFKIRSTYNEPLWSGCFGFGINRIVLIFLEKYGFEVDNWPNELKNIWLNMDY